MSVQQAFLNKSVEDKFRLIFNLPAVLKRRDRKLIVDKNSVDGDSVQFSIYGNIIPDIIVPALEIRYSGNTLYNSSHNKDSFPPNDVKFTIDNKFRNYWVIYSWLNVLHDEVEGIFDAKDLRESDSYLEYMSDMTVQALDEFNEPVFEWTFTKAFPTIMGGITYDQRSDNQIESSFSFVYSQIRAKPV